MELKSRCTDQISKSIDQSIEPIDEPIPIVYLIVKCVFTKKSIILIMDKPQMWDKVVRVCVCVCKGGIRRERVIRGEKICLTRIIETLAEDEPKSCKK